MTRELIGKGKARHRQVVVLMAEDPASIRSKILFWVPPAASFWGFGRPVIVIGTELVEALRSSVCVKTRLTLRAPFAGSMILDGIPPSRLLGSGLQQCA